MRLRFVNERRGSPCEDKRCLGKAGRFTERNTYSYGLPTVLLNTYAYPVPNGKGFLKRVKFIGQGPWISNVMDQCGVSSDLMLRYEITKILLDELFELYIRISDDYRMKGLEVMVIDSRKVIPVGPNDSNKLIGNYWVNELHLSSEAAKMVVQSSWLPVLKSIGLS